MRITSSCGTQRQGSKALPRLPRPRRLRHKDQTSNREMPLSLREPRTAYAASARHQNQGATLTAVSARQESRFRAAGRVSLSFRVHTATCRFRARQPQPLLKHYTEIAKFTSVMSACIPESRAKHKEII